MRYRLKESDGVRYLNSSDSAIQSAIDLEQPHKIIMQNLEYAMGCLMFIPPPQNILMLGVGGGSLIHFFRHYLPSATITGIDYDEDLLQSMHTDFLLPHSDDLLTYETADAQTWIKDNKTPYDLIIVDLFDEQNSPDWVLEQEFMLDLKQSLSDQGCVAWNTLISNDHDFKHYYSQLRKTFNNRTLCLAAEDYENTMAYSFNFDLKQSDMGHLIQQAYEKTEQYELPFHEILNVIFNTNPIDSGFI